ncbi:MAG: [protein-PII] uridylyltransferase [Pseudomonadota bacterium]
MTQPDPSPVPWLLNEAALDRRLAAGEPPHALFREVLDRTRTTLAEAFHEGRPITELVHGRAAVADALLRRAWAHWLPTGVAERLALIAVGGYGRGELHLGSDVDIMILLPETEEPPEEALSAFLTFLWDIGLEVGQSVRSVADCEMESRRDITVATNMMEARRIAGDTGLFEGMRARTGPDRLWNSRAFFEAKWREQITRHRKYHDTAHNLEPNVKESPGGLRDIQMIGWVAKRHFNADTLYSLVGHGFLTEHEYTALAEGQAFLWRVRFGLHVLTGRREDRLLFDHQRALAREFGYTDDTRRLAVEHFMKAYYRTITELRRLNELLLQLFQEEILLTDEPAEEPRPLNSRFQAQRGFIEVAHSGVFTEEPTALLELFLVKARHPELQGVRANTIRLVRDHRHLIDADFRADPRARSLFLEFLRQPRGVTHELRRMNRYGVLAAYIPAFGEIVGQMQHDLFHAYTVDQHTLFVVRNLRRFTVPDFAHEFPLSSSLIAEQTQPELLYLAALFHDIAKGRGGDHSELGAEDAENFCTAHGLSASETELVVWLVRHHLLFSTTAQRKDISDPEVINAFAARVGDRRHLDGLYLLTVADMRATSPTVWNDWKDALLAELYHATRDALERGLDNRLDQAEMVEQHKEEARAQLHHHALAPDALEALWQNFDDEYFRRYSADELVWHAQAILQRGHPEGPLIQFRQKTQRGGTELFIHAPVDPTIFVRTTSVLEQLGLTVADARIVTSRDGQTLNSFTILEENGESISSGERITEIEAALRNGLARPIEEMVHPSHRISRQLKHFPLATRVDLREDPGNQRTVLRVETADRPGLLALIGAELLDAGLRIQNAKITTLGERAEDIFFVTDDQGRPLKDPGLINGLAERIRAAVDNGAETQQRSAG